MRGWIGSNDQHGDGGTPSISISDLVRGMRHRWRMFAVIVVLVTALFVALSFVFPDRYTAEASLRIEPGVRNTAQITQGDNRPPDEALINTEVSLIRSRDVVGAVVDELGLANDIDLVGAETPADDRRDAAISAVTDALTVEREGSSYLVTIEATMAEPQKAADVANAVAAQYVAIRSTSTVEDGNDRLENIEEQMSSMRANLDDAEQRAANFRASRGIVSDGTSGTVTQQQIAPISMQLATAEAQAAEAAAKLASARSEIAGGGIGALSENLNSGVITELQKQRAEIVRERGEVITRYGPNHPATIEANQKLNDIDNQIRAEAQRIESKLASDARATAASAASLRARLNGLQARQASDARHQVTAESLEREAQNQREAYQELSQAAQFARQQREGTLPAGTIAQQALAPSSPSFPNRPLFLVLGAFVGCFLGAGAVGWREMSGQPLLSPQEVMEKVGVGCGGVLPPVTPKLIRKAGSGRAMWEYVVARPTSKYAEALRHIRRAIRSDVRGKTGIYAITSAVPGEGKTSLTLSLGRVAAMAGDRVLVIDCDLRRRALTRELGIEARSSLGDVLSGDARLEEAVVTDFASGMYVLTAGEGDNRALDILGQPEMYDMLSDLRGRFDLVLIDTPPVLAVADARTIAAMSDGTIFSILADSTPAGSASAAVRRLQADGILNLGAILTFTQPSKAARAAMGHSHGNYDSYYAD
ncbi:hypothetical protein GCM10010990_14360 [Croceicoccus mobilis]|uniref:non-specific protein-tyrosine kinase n=1 Tax=Croceicoccus mobilis TaxID=1703339 RepID=A0A916YX26_9SPHN|nr:hypothetical protein GCM10010990_14360 [Croceicoccus mobilis]